MQASEMHQYYIDEGVLPTFANFNDEHKLSQYCHDRAFLFDKLKLPKQYFRGAKIIEFGPDTGENGLVFARWGSRLFFVEPNPKALRQVYQYFDQFGLSEAILGSSGDAIQAFNPEQSFDMVVAEGFLHTVRPNDLWLAKFNQSLHPEGLVLFSYLETAGSLFELFHKVLYRYLCEQSQQDSVEIAQQLFQTKWDSIPHTRPFESWYMDVIKNPYVRWQYLNSAEVLFQEAIDQGFTLYAAWPNYEDGNYVAWHKMIETSEQKHHRIFEHIARSKLSYLMGSKCFYVGADAQLSQALQNDVNTLVECIDQQIDAIDAVGLKRCIDVSQRILLLLEQGDFLSDKPMKHHQARLEMLQSLLTFMAQGETDALLAYCHDNEVFLSTWGMPNHMMVLQKQEAV